MALTPTAEQQQAIDLFKSGQNLAIEAGAGTGKTATLIMLAEAAAAQGRIGQYLAFNRAIVNEAGAKLPGNTTASTAHSLAFRAVGKKYAPRLRSPRMKSMELARRLRMDPLVIRYGEQSKPMAAGYLAGLTMRAVSNFCQSADPEPAEHHVPYVDGIDVPLPDGSRGYTNNRQVRAHVMPAVRRAWADVCDTQGQLPFKHDHYLKIFERSAPRIAADFILFDEAQDASPVLLSIVQQQTHAQLVFVGDGAQAIYGFTGAVNALDRIRESGAASTMLQQSFRFGQAVADVANGLLERLDVELRLIGNPDKLSVVAPMVEPDAILTRTNAVAVETLLAQYDEGRRAALVGGGSEVAAFARAAQDLMAGKWTSHPDLACFSDWAEVRDYVDHDEQGGELRLMVKLVDDYGAAVIIDAIARAADERSCDVTVSTAHKSKGRQWPTVKLAGDFSGPRDGASDCSVDELRLLYVACTRAQRELDVSLVPHALAVPEAVAEKVPAVDAGTVGAHLAEAHAVTSPATLAMHDALHTDGASHEHAASSAPAGYSGPVVTRGPIEVGQ